MAWQERYGTDMMKTFGTPLALLERGDGCWVWDSEGNRYLDFLAGIAVNALGHAHPVFVTAVSEQAARLAHVSNYFATAPQLDTAALLRRLAGEQENTRVYFCNSGAEANEAAFKLARLNNTNASGGGKRTRILALNNSFHGRTMGALALTGKESIRTPFEPMPAGVEHIDATIVALKEAMDERVAAVIMEPIQGEAGVVELPDGLLRVARELTSRDGALLILDEIQTGMGRTGTWFAFERAGIVPDAVTLAKGLGGGFPIGALLTFGAASGLFQAGHHGSTYAGNPLATHVSGAVLGEIERAGLLGNAERRGQQLREIITAIDSPLFTEIRGRGLLLGIGLADAIAPQLAAAAQANGLIVNAANPSTIRLAPPLIVGDDELAEFDARFRLALAVL